MGLTKMSKSRVQNRERRPIRRPFQQTKCLDQFVRFAEDKIGSRSEQEDALDGECELFLLLTVENPLYVLGSDMGED